MMMNLRRILFLALSLLTIQTSIFAADKVNWVDITSRFITNTDFNSGNYDGWKVDSNAGQKSVSANIMRFWNGTFDFSQEIIQLPKGKYRLSVQGFYRAHGDDYEAYKNGTENITAFLYAGDASIPLVSIYSESMTSTEGNRQQHEGKYYPDNSVSAAAAFAEGNYKHNFLEFEAEGNVTIGVRCEQGESDNYCALDNFKLEYYGDLSDIVNIADSSSLFINEIMASNVDEYISPAFNFDGWVELYNPTDRAVELNGLKVSDPINGNGPWTMPMTMGVIPAKGYRLVWFDSNDINPNNAPFKLDVDGGKIVFSDADGNEIASQEYPAALERISYARAKDGTGKWGFASTSTPGASNNGITHLTQQLEAPVVNQPSQLFEGSLSVKVTIPSGYTLRYTTDGTLPTLQNGQTSTNGSFTISKTSNYRFRLYASNQLPSRVTTRSYILKDRGYYLPVVSVVSNPDFIYSKEIGVFEKGPNGRPGNGQSENCNWNMNWERPVNFSFLDANGEMVLNQDVNLEMCGGWSRAWTPHSFKLKGDKEMGGDKNLPYPFFDQKPYIRNRTLQIRNGGNDNSARFKDPAIQVILERAGINLDCQSYQPVHEFINGKYIGVLNMREPNNKHFVYANYGWDDDEIDQWEMSPDSGYVQKCGTPDAFIELVDVLSPNAANAQTYEEISRVLDIDEFINYMAAQLYLGGTDYPQNNVKSFRHRDGGRFRFVIFDLDFAFDTSNPFGVFFDKENYLFNELYPRGQARIQAQIRLVTLFKNMLKNNDFRRRFIDAYCIMGGSVFEASRCETIINELLDRVEPAMNLNNESASWKATEVKNGFKNRLSTAISALKNYSTFNLSSVTARKVSLSSDTPGAHLYINDMEVPTGAFNGQLFAPVVFKAVAPAGYQFYRWESNGKSYSTNATIMMPSSDINLVATFKALTNSEMTAQGIHPVCINEVSGSNDTYIDEYRKKGDWVELYNTTDQPIDVEGMYLTDNLAKPTKYQITKGKTSANTIIPANGYLIIWCDKRETTDNGLHASFKIDGDGGLLVLSPADQSWQDVLVYGAHDARTTVGRYPDGTADVYALSAATIGKSNLKTSYMTAVSQENEQLTRVANTIAAANGLRICYASQQLIVKSEEETPVSIAIYMANGQVIEKMQVSPRSGKAYLNVAHLPHGFYIARATNANGTTVSCKFER